jgi:xanthine/CO dehydrogenase XdhC/CoxF family maturation factor
VDSLDFLIKLADDLKNRKNVVLVCIISSLRSVSRDSSRKILVYEDATIYGSWWWHT